MNRKKNNSTSPQKEIKALSHRFEYDEEGRAVIHMTVQDDSDFLSVYSEHTTPVISAEVAEFLENSTHSLRPRHPLTLRIHSDCIDEGEAETYKDAIREYYGQKYLAGKRERRFHFWTVLILALAGVLTLMLAFLVDHDIWSEVIDIAAWVFLWEAVDVGVFKSRENDIMRRRYLSFLSMKIEYLPLHSKNEAP